MQGRPTLTDLNPVEPKCYPFMSILGKCGGISNSANDLYTSLSYEIILICNILYKTLIGPKLLRIRFDKIDGFVRVYNGVRYLVLFGPGKYVAIYNRIRYLISQKSGTTHVFSHNYARLKLDSYDFLTIEKMSTLHNVIMLIK